jgi:Tfp pilus assembly protein PilF
VLLNEAIDLQHDLADAHFQLGKLREQRGQRADAADCHEMALHFDAGHVPARRALAGLQQALGDHAEAAAHFRKLIDLDARDPAAHGNLCLALYELGAYEEARSHGERAVALDPRMAEAHHNLGLVLSALGEPAPAVAHFRRALDIKPLAAIAAGLGHALRDLGQIDQAIAAYDRALRLTPGYGDAVSNRAQAYLLKEDYRPGWEQYEKRFEASGTAVRDFGLPRWNGEPLTGKTILVHAEQGLGDEIMFMSCLPDLVERAERVVIECSQRLAALVRRSFPRAIVHGGSKEDPSDWIAQLGPVHCQLPIGSLPRWFRPERAAFPTAGGYLRPDPRTVSGWRSRLELGGKPAVGLSWRGGTPKTRARLRSMTLEHLTPVLRPDVVWVSLQHGTDCAELSGPAAVIRNFAGVTEDLDQLAALICALDLVVTVDNTNLHLSGALGRPAWAMLPASAEWRYGCGGATMPWYPSVRLLRQGADWRWQPVIEQLGAELAEYIGHTGTRSS